MTVRIHYRTLCNEANPYIFIAGSEDYNRVEGGYRLMPALSPTRYRAFVAHYQQQIRAVLDENKHHPFRYFFPLTTQNTWQSSYYQGAESYARLQLLDDGVVYFTSPSWFLWVASHCNVEVSTSDVRAAHGDMCLDRHLGVIRSGRQRLSAIKFALSHFSWPRTVPRGLRYCFYSVWTQSGFYKWQKDRTEPFYGSLPWTIDQALVLYHQEGAWSGNTGDEAMHKIRRDSQSLRWRDWCALLVTLLLFKLRLPLSPEMHVAAMRHDLRATLANQLVLALLAYYSARNIALKNPNVKFITLYEGNCWEQGVLASAAAHGQKVIGVQHTAITPAFLKMWGDGCRPVPDHIVASGAIPADLLVKLMGHNKGKIYPGCQLRGSFTYNDRASIAGKKILVLLQGGPYDLVLLQRLKKVRLDRPVLVRPHPGQYPGKLEGFKLANGTLQDNLQEAAVVIYNGTTASFDALAAGVPCIYVSCGDEGRHDPMSTLRTEIKRDCYEDDDLAALIREIESLSSSAYHSACAQCHQYIKEYFYPSDVLGLRALKEFIDHV